MKRAIVARGILALSLAVVLVIATASTAGAHRAARASLKPGGVGFGDQQVGTTSPAQAFTLSVRCRLAGGCNDNLLNPRISVSGDYAQTNNCPTTLPQSQDLSCTINVTFAPTSTGPKRGTLRTGKGTCVRRAHSPQAHKAPCAGPAAMLNGSGVTTPTAPTPPLTLDAGGHLFSSGQLKVYASTNHYSAPPSRIPLG